MKALVTSLCFLTMVMSCNQDRKLENDQVREVEQQREETLSPSDLREDNSYYEEKKLEDDVVYP